MSGEPIADGLVVRLLGPVELVTAARGLRPVDQPKQRVLVAMLAVAAGRIVADEALVDALWAEEWSPERARNLHSHVSALRRRLGAAEPSRDRPRVVRAGGGYRFVLADDELDVSVFRSLAMRGQQASRLDDVASAAGLFQRALDVWRGPALADVARWCGRLSGDAAALEELRAAVVEDLAECDLELGRAASVAAQAACLLSEFPLRERLAGQLMVALWRCGRRGEALSVFDRTRRELSVELGLAPGPELAQLHAKVLADDPSLAFAPVGRAAPQPAGTLDAGRVAVVPRQLPVAPGLLAGRDAELTALHGLLDELGQSRDPDLPATLVVVAIAGMAGVGKSALAVHWARTVSERFPGGQLYVNLRGFDPTGAPVTPDEVVAWFLAALGVPAAEIPVDAEARAGLYRSILAERRVLILLDNARDAAQARPLLAGGPGCVVIVTSRSSLAGLAATAGARLMHLRALTADESATLLGARLGNARVASEPAGVAEMIRISAGLPLALAILSARAAESPELPLTFLTTALKNEPDWLDALDGSDHAASLRAAFSLSLRYLSESAAQMFALLGVHFGPDISRSAAASLAGISLAEARTALTELASLNLAREHVPGRYVLHDLLRAYARERAVDVLSDVERRDAVTRSLDHYLHTMDGVPSFWVTFPLGVPRSGVIAEQLSGHGQLLAWLKAEHQVLRQAVERAATEFEVEAWQLCHYFIFASYWLGTWADGEAAARTVLAAVARIGDDTGLGWTHLGLANLRYGLGATGEAVTEFRLALKHFRRARDIAGQAIAHLYTSIALSVDTPGGIARSLDRAGWTGPSAKARHRARSGWAHAQQALVLSEQRGMTGDRAVALAYSGWHLAELGDFDLAIRHCREAVELAHELADPGAISVAWEGLGVVHHAAGDLDQAISSFKHALDALPDVGPRSALPRAEILAKLGDACDAAGDGYAAAEARRAALRIYDSLRHPDAEYFRAKIQAP